MKIVRTTNRYFNLTIKAIKAYLDRKGIKPYYYFRRNGNWEYKPVAVEDIDCARDKNYIGIYRATYEPIDPNTFKKDIFFNIEDIKRDDADLVAIIEEYGSEFACGYPDELVVIDIPNNVKWYIKVQDEELGDELIVEEHRTW